MSKFILGVDPGLARTGLGLIELKDGKATYVDHQLLITQAKYPTHQRLQSIFQQGQAFIAKYNKIDTFVIEELFVGINRNTIIKLSMARSMIMLLASMTEAEVFNVPTRLIKQKITGFGGAQKEDVLAKVCEKLNLTDFTQLDCSDALACALYNVETEANNV